MSLTPVVVVVAAGVDPMPNRHSLHVDFARNHKDGELQCKKHKDADCNVCFGHGFA